MATNFRGPIGCPDSYSVAIMRQPGRSTDELTTPVTAAHPDEILSIRWGRVENDKASATVEISKCPTNRALFSSYPDLPKWTKIDPWAHEIWIYRDKELAFVGPIVHLRGTRTSFIIEAWDMLGWLARREATFNNTALGIQATEMAENMLDIYFGPGGFDPDNDPDLFRHRWLLNQSTALIDRDYIGGQSFILDRYKDLVPAGLRFTTLGRRILIYSQIPDNNTNPYLLDGNDIIGDLEIVKDGVNYGSRVLAKGEGYISRVGPTAGDRLYYGLVDHPHVQVNDTTSQSELNDITQEIYQDLRDLSPELVVPSGSTLSSEAQIANTGYLFEPDTPTGPRTALPDLVCGMRYDVNVGEPDFDPGNFPMRLGEISTTWTPDQGEKIAVSFINLGFAASA